MRGAEKKRRELSRRWDRHMKFWISPRYDFYISWVYRIYFPHARNLSWELLEFYQDNQAFFRGLFLHEDFSSPLFDLYSYFLKYEALISPLYRCAMVEKCRVFIH